MDQVNVSSPQASRMTGLAGAMLGLLSVQFVLGKLINLFVDLPSNADKQEQMKELFSQWQYAGHIIVGTFLVILAIILVIGSFKAKHGMMKVLSVVGFAALVVASIGGRMFVDSYSSTGSLVMALGFIVAMGVYGRFMSVVMSAK